MIGTSEVKGLLKLGCWEVVIKNEMLGIGRLKLLVMTGIGIWPRKGRRRGYWKKGPNVGRSIY